MSLNISLYNLVPKSKKNFFTKVLLFVLDRILGIHHLDSLYKKNQLCGLEKHHFSDGLIKALNLQITGIDELISKIPEKGPLVIASNHPYGGIEGVVLASSLERLRPDIKVLANKGLIIFPELRDYFILTNPLVENDPINAKSIRDCLKHLSQGGALLIFPAGRVSYFHKDTKRIADHSWHRLLASLVNRSGAKVVSVFVSGQNSPLFYQLGRIYYRFRLLMLARELANKSNSKIQVEASTAIDSKSYKFVKDLNLQTQLMRVQSYLMDPSYRKPWPKDPITEMKPVHPAIKGSIILQEVAHLPKEQLLLDFNNLAVYYGYKNQIPAVVIEIARLRELVFRQHNEGSGEALDTDIFDESYTHLFVMNRETGQIIGAYRMGQTDRLLSEGDLNKLYLNRMFEFGPDFVNQKEACLEMGRSFLIPEYQRNFQGLYLLWRGIGAFVCKYPHYRTLYGTISISKLYDQRSVALIETALVSPTDSVKPRANFSYDLHPEVLDFAQNHELKNHLTTLLKGIETDAKDLPILLKQYQKMGAQFHYLGIDKSFNDTPGLLLTVDLPAAPEKYLKLYLGDDWENFVHAKY
ncbi:MAG: GNAT family N-acetyltransferase [Microcystis sp. LE19-388.1G]|nr:GNAT family N-acetyltransferase [Microcystis sp. LE19-388.1G]